MTTPTPTREMFHESPEYERAFRAWLAAQSPAMVDASPDALEPFPYRQPQTPPRYIMELIASSDWSDDE